VFGFVARLIKETVGSARFRSSGSDKKEEKRVVAVE